VLSFSAPDQPGIVAPVSSCVAALGCDIRDAQVHGDAASGLFFVRLVLVSPVSREEVALALSPVARSLRLDWGAGAARLQGAHGGPRVEVRPCLIDLIHRTEIGMLPIEITAVVSNHETMHEGRVARVDVPPPPQRRQTRAGGRHP
jgi:formyltetrahydrofolate deformylase